MSISARRLAVSLSLAAGVVMVSVGAQAAPIGQPLAIAKEGSSQIEQVYWRGRGWGWGWGGPFVAGALIGGAIAAPYYYGYYGPYGYGPGPYYPAYAPPPPYAAAPPPGGADEEYCMRRFKSYDPNTGTYRGTDGRRHPCP